MVVLLAAAPLALARGGPVPGDELLSAAARGDGSARVANAGKRPRPADALPGAGASAGTPNAWQIYNDFATPAVRHASTRAVVHYVRTGIDAPPLNDDDGDGVPDYVERVGEAADAAITYFEQRGFRRIRPDAGGGDERPDLYISRFAPGTFGVAIPARRADGGAFVVVANNLDPNEDESFAGLYGTVAHEIFHLVQFSYFPPDVEPPLPEWVLEGTAAALEGRAFPEHSDFLWDLQVRPWLAAPARSMTAQSYAAGLLWRHLDAHSPSLIHAYLSRWAAGRERGNGAGALVDAYARATGRPFAPAFHRFALAAAEENGARITPQRVLARGRREASSTVAHLAVHYVRLASGARAPASITVRLPARDALGVSLTYTLESDVAGMPSRQRTIAARKSGGARVLTFTVPAGLRTSERFVRPTLVVSNGSASRRSYSVATR
jgi:hypothetical protein